MRSRFVSNTEDLSWELLGKPRAIFKNWTWEAGFIYILTSRNLSRIYRRSKYEYQILPIFSFSISTEQGLKFPFYKKTLSFPSSTCGFIFWGTSWLIFSLIWSAMWMAIIQHLLHFMNSFITFWVLLVIFLVYFQRLNHLGVLTSLLHIWSITLLTVEMLILISLSIFFLSLLFCSTSFTMCYFSEYVNLEYFFLASICLSVFQWFKDWLYFRAEKVTFLTVEQSSRLISPNLAAKLTLPDNISSLTDANPRTKSNNSSAKYMLYANFISVNLFCKFQSSDLFFWSIFSSLLDFLLC